MSSTLPPLQPSKNRGGRTTVLHIAPDVEAGDPGRETVDLAVLTQRSGWRAVIASSGGRLAQEAERAAVLHKRAPLDRGGRLGNWRSRMHLESVMQAERPAVIHAHGIDMVGFALEIGRGHGLPLVADLTQPLTDTPRHKEILDQIKCMRAMIRVPSYFMGDHLGDVFGVGEDRLRLVPPGVDLQCFSVGFISPERLQNLSRLWRLPENASVILAPIPLESEMGHRTLLEALREMRDDPVYAVIVGRERRVSALRAEIEGLISELGLSGKVIMPDDCPDFPAACWLSSVVVAPNLVPRGQNLELLAAQAVGRPVIASDVGANREMARSGETAWVVKPGDVPALVAALREAVGFGTEQRVGLAQATHDFVAASFPQRAWFDGMMDIYQTLIHPSRVTMKAEAG